MDQFSVSVVQCKTSVVFCYLDNPVYIQIRLNFVFAPANEVQKIFPENLSVSAVSFGNGLHCQSQFLHIFPMPGQLNILLFHQTCVVNNAVFDYRSKIVGGIYANLVIPVQYFPGFRLH